MASKIVSFTLNGRETEVMVKPLTTLQKLLREQLGLTATKAGCKQGGCGSCTVLVNGEPMMSCLLVTMTPPCPVALAPVGSRTRWVLSRLSREPPTRSPLAYAPRPAAMPISSSNGGRSSGLRTGAEHAPP